MSTFAFGKLRTPRMHTCLDDRARLLDILTRRSLSFGEVELSSGEKSGVYVDGKLTTCWPEAMPLIGHLFLQEIEKQGWNPDAVGGLTVGADPIAFAVARESLGKQPPVSAFIVRKQPKDHGKHKFIEGLENPSKCSVVIIDDVCTKGGSTGQAIEKARAAGMTVLGAICLVDREQGATDLLETKYQCKLAKIYTLSEMLSHYETLRREQIAV